MRVVALVCIMACSGEQPTIDPPREPPPRGAEDDTSMTTEAPGGMNEVVNHDMVSSEPTGATGLNGATGGTQHVDTVAPTGATPPASGLRWPLGGTDGSAWVINNYVDLNNGAGVLDYTGGAKSYNGHLGIDIDLPNFRAMDAGVDILAIEDGVVETVIAQYPDRHYACVDDNWNAVYVRHADGSLAMYGHMRANSPAVSQGQTVRTGDVLGKVGSSGCSTTAHLHLELRAAWGGVIDPFLLMLWLSPPVYQTPFTIMDLALRDGAFTTIDQVKDPGPDAAQVSGVLGIALSVAGGDTADKIAVRAERPNGAVAYNGVATFTQSYRHSFWYWNHDLTSAMKGTWTIRALVNDNVVITKQVVVP